MDKINCKKCNIYKVQSDFVKDKTRKSGYHPYCRVCQNKIKNTKRNKERAIAWNRKNKGRRSEIRKKWYNKNPELVRLYRVQRRLREHNASDGTLNKYSLSKLPKDKCSVCSFDLDWDTNGSVHLDHIVPLAKGGRHSITNVQWTCSTCNLEKGAMDLELYKMKKIDYDHKDGKFKSEKANRGNDGSGTKKEGKKIR